MGDEMEQPVKENAAELLAGTIRAVAQTIMEIDGDRERIAVLMFLAPELEQVAEYKRLVVDRHPPVPDTPLMEQVVRGDVGWHVAPDCDPWSSADVAKTIQWIWEVFDRTSSAEIIRSVVNGGNPESIDRSVLDTLCRCTPETVPALDHWAMVVPEASVVEVCHYLMDSSAQPGRVFAINAIAHRLPETMLCEVWDRRKDLLSRSNAWGGDLAFYGRFSMLLPEDRITELLKEVGSRHEDSMMAILSDYAVRCGSLEAFRQTIRDVSMITYLGYEMETILADDSLLLTYIAAHASNPQRVYTTFFSCLPSGQQANVVNRLARNPQHLDMVMQRVLPRAAHDLVRQIDDHGDAINALVRNEDLFGGELLSWVVPDIIGRIDRIDDRLEKAKVIAAHAPFFVRHNVLDQVFERFPENGIGTIIPQAVLTTLVPCLNRHQMEVIANLMAATAVSSQCLAGYLTTIAETITDELVPTYLALAIWSGNDALIRSLGQRLHPSDLPHTLHAIPRFASKWFNAPSRMKNDLATLLARMPEDAIMQSYPLVLTWDHPVTPHVFEAMWPYIPSEHSESVISMIVAMQHDDMQRHLIACIVPTLDATYHAAMLRAIPMIDCLRNQMTAIALLFPVLHARHFGEALTILRQTTIDQAWGLSLIVPTMSNEQLKDVIAMAEQLPPSEYLETALIKRTSNETLAAVVKRIQGEPNEDVRATYFRILLRHTTCASSDPDIVVPAVLAEIHNTRMEMDTITPDLFTALASYAPPAWLEPIFQAAHKRRELVGIATGITPDVLPHAFAATLILSRRRRAIVIPHLAKRLADESTIALYEATLRTIATIADLRHRADVLEAIMPGLPFEVVPMASAVAKTMTHPCVQRRAFAWLVDW